MILINLLIGKINFFHSYSCRWHFNSKTKLSLVVVVQSLSRVRLFETPRNVARQAPLSMGFSRQENWGGLSFPSPEDIPNPWIKPVSHVSAGGFFTAQPPGKPQGVSDILFKLRQGGTWHILEAQKILIELIKEQHWGKLAKVGVGNGWKVRSGGDGRGGRRNMQFLFLSSSCLFVGHTAQTCNLTSIILSQNFSLVISSSLRSYVLRK